MKCWQYSEINSAFVLLKLTERKEGSWGHYHSEKTKQKWMSVAAFSVCVVHRYVWPDHRRIMAHTINSADPYPPQRLRGGFCNSILWLETNQRVIGQDYLSSCTIDVLITTWIMLTFVKLCGTTSFLSFLTIDLPFYRWGHWDSQGANIEIRSA